MGVSNNAIGSPSFLAIIKAVIANRLRSNGYGCEARIGTRKTFSVIELRNRKTPDETSRAAE